LNREKVRADGETQHGEWAKKKEKAQGKETSSHFHRLIGKHKSIEKATLRSSLKEGK